MTELILQVLRLGCLLNVCDVIVPSYDSLHSELFQKLPALFRAYYFWVFLSCLINCLKHGG